MKPILATLALLALAGLPATLPAADQVTLQVRYGKERDLRTVVIDLHPDAAPATVENFRKLVRKGFYNGLAFHRAFPGYLVQTGDPQSRRRSGRAVGTGGPGYTLPPEIRLKTKPGSVAMGRLPDRINPGRLSNGSQFFILLKNDPKLDGAYTVFGTVSSGQEVVEEISRKPTDSNDMPSDRVVIHKARLGGPVGPGDKPARTRRFWLF